MASWKELSREGHLGLGGQQTDCEQEMRYHSKGDQQHPGLH